jgi:alginate O-acetyltransferase complex protein AlgI
MEFNSVIYIAFLALVAVLYYTALKTYRAQRVLILGASAVFYAFWSLPFLLHLYGVLLANFWVSLQLLRRTDPVVRRRWLIAGLVGNVVNLVVFKYAGLAVGTANSLLGWLGWRDTMLPDIQPLLPLAISFYTFSVVSYLVDVYRDPRGQARDAADFLFYATFFPHLIAGPILRKDEFFPQCGYQPARWDNIRTGLHRIIVGLFQKAVVADNLAIIVDHGFRNTATLSTAETTVVLVAYSFQIFFDFAGYSAIAIGSARLLGYVFPENFNTPYIALNIADFWRRWHMTLSRWIRDYIYIPLGGSRSGPIATNVNLLVTMGIAGLWHGASWNFAVWGLWHGAGLVIHRLYAASALLTLLVRMPELAYKGLCLAVTFVFVTFAWVLFRAPDFATAAAIYAKFLPAHAGNWSLEEAWLLKSYGFTALVLYGIAVLLARSPIIRAAIFDVTRRRAMLYAGIVALTLVLAPLRTDPFIYFRF